MNRRLEDLCYDPATDFESSSSEELGDDIYGRPVTEADADGNTTGISYSDGLLDSTVTTTPPTGAVTLEDDNASAGTVTTTDTSGGATVAETVESLNYAGEPVKELDSTGTGSPEETDEAYNAQGQEGQTTEPEGTVDKTVFDNFGREFEQLTGNGSGAWTTDDEQIYDNNGVGDSDPTEQIEDPAGSPQITKDYDNWEDEQVASESGLGMGADTSVQKPLIDFTSVNNLGQTTLDETFDGALASISGPVAGVVAAPTDSAALRSETQYTIDALGNDSQTVTSDVDQSNGEVLETDTTTDTYDANGDPTVSDDSGSDDEGSSTLDGDTSSSDSAQAITTNTTDDAGRVTGTKTTVGGTVTSQTQTQFDANGNAIFVTSSVLEPGGSTRTTYVANWYDSDGNLSTTVNYGTNGGTSMSSRPGTIPSRSTTPGAPQRTDYTYTAEGQVASTTDPRGLITTNTYDEQGNVTQTVSDSGGIAQTTNFTYNSDNQVVDTTAEDPGGVSETTANVYGPSGADNDKSLLLAVEYPDPTTGAASSSQQVTYTYNSDGSVATMTDRDGTVHSYQYDDDGNQTADVITTLGHGVDGTVMERDTTYNDEDQPVDSTTRNAAGDILSQVQDAYDGNGEVISEAQSHDGAVTGDTPTVGYGYQETQGGQERQSSITYPDGREISFGYSSSLADAEGWIDTVSDANQFGEGTLASYSYAGDGTDMGQSRPQTGANEAITLDNFGDIADLNWTNSAGTSTDHFGFGYDADGNVMYKENYLDTADSELYHANGATPGYDGLNRLTTFARGTLSSSTGTTLDTISSPSTTQSWTLDALGNQSAVTTNGTTQSKTQNGQNQTTGVTTGGTTSTLAYDANGATTTDEQGRVWTYDAWGDPVTFTSPATGQETVYGYNALGQRITSATLLGNTSPVLAVNDGSAQRSMVDSLTVIFPSAVTLSSGAITLYNTTTSSAQTVSYSNPSGDSKTWLVTWSGTGIVGGSLPNGVYNLTLTAADVTGITLSSNVTWTFHRLFGDVNGDATVDATDDAAFSDAYGASAGSPQYDPAFDYNASGFVNSLSANRLARDYGVTYTYTSSGAPFVSAPLPGSTVAQDCSPWENVTDFYYSTAGQVIEEDKGGSVFSQTVYGPMYVNDVIEVDQATGSPGTLDQRVYLQQDANHNVTSVTDTSGTVQERYIYSPNGEQTVLNADGSVKGDGTPASSSYSVPHGFQGMLFDPVTSDNLTPNRVYDPMLGTWTSEDPIGYGDGMNIYEFEHANPERYTDPTGTNAPDFGQGLDRSSSPIEFMSWSPRMQNAWVGALLTSWGGFIHNAAVKYNVPEKLLQIIIINEMMDMRIRKVFNFSRSMGPAQIKLFTAIDDHAFDGAMGAKAIGRQGTAGSIKSAYAWRAKHPGANDDLVTFGRGGGPAQLDPLTRLTLQAYLLDAEANIDAAGKMLRGMLDGLASDFIKKRLSASFRNTIISPLATTDDIVVKNAPESVGITPSEDLIRAVNAMWDEGQQIKYDKNLELNYTKAIINASNADFVAARALQQYEAWLKNNPPAAPTPPSNGSGTTSGGPDFVKYRIFD